MNIYFQRKTFGAKCPGIKWKSFILLSACIIISINSTLAGNDVKDTTSAISNPFLKNKTFEPIAIIEAWGTYSVTEEKEELKYGNRFDVHLRRFRFGARGQVHPAVKYSFMFHYDRLGEDAYAATKGSDKGMGIWNAYLTVKLLKSSQLLNLHAGYFWAAISREYNTSPWAVSSFDKTCSAGYLRSFMTATGNGIVSGAGLGGLVNFRNHSGISYRIAVHNPGRHISPHYANPLFSGRVMISLGYPEQREYKYMLSGNQWRKRNGITCGFGGAYQGKTDNEKPGSDSIFFDRSFAYGVDLLLNYKGLSIDGEYFVMRRSTQEIYDFYGYEGHFRCSWIFKVGTYFIEPAFMTSFYKGNGNSELFSHIGDDVTHDVGINWYLHKDKLKFSIHYIIQDGMASSDTGDYAGTSLQMKL